MAMTWPPIRESILVVENPPGRLLAVVVRVFASIICGFGIIVVGALAASYGSGAAVIGTFCVALIMLSFFVVAQMLTYLRLIAEAVTR